MKTTTQAALTAIGLAVSLASAVALQPEPFNWDKCDWVVTELGDMPPHWKEAVRTPSGRNWCVTTRNPAN